MNGLQHNHNNINNDNNGDKPSRHFVQYVVPDGIIGSLGIVQKGDELLQANGHRIRGTSHTSTLRYLRSLPSRIELVFARKKPTHLTEDVNGGVMVTNEDSDQLMDNTDEPPLEVVASEVGSVDTAASMRLVNSYDVTDRPAYSGPVSPAAAHRRVTEWIRKSQGDLCVTVPYPSSPESASIFEPSHARSEKASSYDHGPLNFHTFDPRRDYMNFNHINGAPYSLNTTTLDISRRLPVSKSSRGFTESLSSEQQYDRRRYQTLPHNRRPQRIDPRYGFKRPSWSSVPLIIQLDKSSRGFGFSIAEYEELPVTDLEGKTSRKAFTLDRKSTSTTLDSDRQSFRSYRSSSTSSPSRNIKSSSTLKRRSTWSSRLKTHGILLIDSLTPGGVAQLDGRISIGDRLLFVNDRNLMKSSVREAAHTLKSLPNGPCLIGIAKMQLESNETDNIQEQQQPPYPTQSMLPPTSHVRPSVIGLFPGGDDNRKISVHSNSTYPLQVNTGAANDGNNTVVDGFNVVAGIEDLALDFYTLPLLCPNPELHAPDLQYVTPVDPSLEVTKCLERGLLPIGMKLDALACHGQDGCRVLQVLGGGAIARDQILVTNDYVTSLNGHSMRHLDNLGAFEILHSLSQSSAVIEIKYLPASVVESHRIECLSKAMNPSVDRFNQKSSMPYSSIIQPVNWSVPIEIVLHRSDPSQQWGLVVSGPEICSVFNCLPPMNLKNPSIISEIYPNSVAKICKLLSCGLLILQIQGNDVSTKGSDYINMYLQYLSNQSDIRELRLVVCHYNDDSGGGGDESKQKALLQLASQNNYGLDASDKIESPNSLNMAPAVHNQMQQKSGGIQSGISPGSSDMENPEPLTDMESREEVHILSREVPSPDPNNSSDSQQKDSCRINQSRRNSSQCLLSKVSSPIVKDDDDETGGLRNAMSSDLTKLQNGQLSRHSPPTVPPRRLSVPSRKQSVGNSTKAVISISGVNQMRFDNLANLYSRNNQDEILIVRIPLPSSSPSLSPMPNGDIDCDQGDQSRVINLGIRLVGSRNPENVATFIAGFQKDSIAMHHNVGLQIGDEIVQVEGVSVCGMNHLTVHQTIQSKIKEILMSKIDTDQDDTIDNHISVKQISDSTLPIKKSFITLIIRRNPINLSLMTSSPTGLSTLYEHTGSPIKVVSKPPSDVYSPLDENTFNTSPTSEVLSSSSDLLPTGSKPIPHSFLKQIMIELNEDFHKFQLFDINLERSPDGFGIFIVNLGPNNESGVFVTEIRPNSPASLQGVLRPHDRILAIDGQLQHDYEKTLELLQQSRKSVRLTIGRQIPSKSESAQQSTTAIAQVTSIDAKRSNNNHNKDQAKPSIVPGIPATVTLYKNDGGLGFSIVGGSDTVLGNILIHEIHSGGAASRDGRLQVGDRLLAVNGIDLREATQKDATKIIRAAEDCIQLLVYRDPEPQYLNQGVFECYSVTLKRDVPGQSLGLSLIGRPHYSTGTAIGGITENSPASRSNLLEVGDIILEINGWDMRLAKSDEVVNLLKKAHGEVKLLIGRYKTSPSLYAYPRNRLHVYVVVLERRQLGFSNIQDGHQSTCGQSTPAPDEEQQLLSPQQQFVSHVNQNGLLSPLISKQVVGDHNTDDGGGGNVDEDIDANDEIASAAFGLRIREANSQELWDSYSRLIVDSIQPYSPADRSGMIMPGDRLLTVDREPVDWLSPTEVVQLLATLPYCTIELGRLPYLNLPSDVKVHNHASMINNAVHNDNSSNSHSSTPSPFQRVEREEHDIHPPYPPPSEELPALFGGNMPYIEPPNFIRDMETLREQPDDDLDEQAENIIENTPNQVGFESLLQKPTDSRYEQNQPNTIGSKDHIDYLTVNMTPLSSDEIEKALELAERASGGFYVRQICLPAAPLVNTPTKDELNQHESSQPRLGLRLIDGPGVSGPVVVRIEPDSCVSRTDIQIGDRILGLDDKLLLCFSQGQGDNSANDILRTIENIWISRSMNSSSSEFTSYEQNPCRLTIISNRSLALSVAPTSNSSCIDIDSCSNTKKEVEEPLLTAKQTVEVL
ncbi:unnamed protein product [Heterobilharzia americana]|nr:unnamed protein product [Heterobilharzia americana]